MKEQCDVMLAVSTLSLDAASAFPSLNHGVQVNLLIFAGVRFMMTLSNHHRKRFG